MVSESIQPHMHSRSPCPSTQCPRSPHHPKPCFTFTSLRCDALQRRMYHKLHKNWMHHLILRPHHHLWPQMHTNRSEVDSSQKGMQWLLEPIFSPRPTNLSPTLPPLHQPSNMPGMSINSCALLRRPCFSLPSTKAPR